MAKEHPITIEEFSHFMRRFALPASSRFGVAVSGGPDSMALALCAKNWSESGEFVALIVEHGLRPESAEEAAAVKMSLEAMGIETEILRWEHPPVKSKIHVEARKARYGLLTDACKKRGIAHLLFAHHRDDNAETVLMRFAKGSGIEGLAGIPAESESDGIRILRPFLSVPKKRLVATCEAENIAFATDPSNEAQKYARGRLRNIQALLEKEGFTPDRLADLAERAGEAKEALDYYAKSLFRVSVSKDIAGVVRLDLEYLRSSPLAISVRVISECLNTVHSEEYPPERASLMNLSFALLDDAPMGARTLRGCVIGKTERYATFVREYSAIKEKSPVAAGETVIWDGRWSVALSASCGDTGLYVAALGFQTRETLDRMSPDLRHAVPQGRARAALPSLWKEGELFAAPDFSQNRKAIFSCRI